MKKMLVWAFIAASAISCSNSAKHSRENSFEEYVDTIHTAQNALDYEGTYEGVVPCADCEGIKTVITIKYDGTYAMKFSYLGKNNTVYEKSGSYKWDKSGQVIILEGIENGPDKYFVGENHIRQLDMNGQDITGMLAEMYILEKKE
ncbi:MAG: copper resistance protein NlpE [Dysgonamonadaceae bacterium]|jgi:uncharacterized lipoprotein NlpE involved in copper resistance|nr:copper resistance protein NlpE [Dysgonamonadaceae bacterium]